MKRISNFTTWCTIICCIIAQIIMFCATFEMTSTNSVYLLLQNIQEDNGELIYSTENLEKAKIQTFEKICDLRNKIDIHNDIYHKLIFNSETKEVTTVTNKETYDESTYDMLGYKNTVDDTLFINNKIFDVVEKYNKIRSSYKNIYRTYLPGGSLSALLVFILSKLLNLKLKQKTKAAISGAMIAITLFSIVSLISFVCNVQSFTEYLDIHGSELINLIKSITI